MRSLLGPRRRTRKMTRRLALSMAISGDQGASGALAVLDPLVEPTGSVRPRGARAFVYALTGTHKPRAMRLLMPSNQAAAITPFLSKIGTLKPAQKAMAVNFGQIPTGRGCRREEPHAAGERNRTPCPRPRPSVSRCLRPRHPAGSRVDPCRQAARPIGCRRPLRKPARPSCPEHRRGSSGRPRSATLSTNSTVSRVDRLHVDDLLHEREATAAIGRITRTVEIGDHGRRIQRRAVMEFHIGTQLDPIGLHIVGHREALGEERYGLAFLVDVEQAFVDACRELAFR